MRVRLTQVTVSATTIRATIAVAASGKGSGWAPIGGFEHGGRIYPIAMSGTSDAALTVQTMDGTTAASGDWTLRIDELVGQDGEAQVRLQGPWVIPFWVP